MNIKELLIGMIKKPMVKMLILALALGSCNNAEPEIPNDSDREMRPPNILIVSADDLAYNSVGAFGNEMKDITPNLDTLASEGVRFMHAHVTTPVCQPGRQSLITGLYPHNNGSEGFEPIDHDVTPLTSYLKKAGYMNGILGKEVHHQPVLKYDWDYIPHFTDPDSIWRSGHSRTPDLFYEYSDHFFKMAKRLDTPFFLSANSHDPHRPFSASKSEMDSWGDNAPPVTKIYESDQIEMLGYLPDIPDVRKEVTQYYSGVHRTDRNIGAVLTALKENGLEDNTLVIFYSDHGAPFPFSKSQVYLNGTKTPLIIKWPGVTTPGFVDEEHLVSTADLMPTILDIVDLEIPENLDGKSVVPLLETGEQELRPYIFTSFYQLFSQQRIPMRSIQNKEFGYIYNFWADGSTPMTGDAMVGLTWEAMKEAAKTDPEITKRVELYEFRVREEFYNYEKDPNALNNLIDDPAYQDEIETFRKKMLEYMKKYNDPAYEAYKNRDKPGTIEAFMEEQREKAKNTGTDIRF